MFLSKWIIDFEEELIIKQRIEIVAYTLKILNPSHNDFFLVEQIFFPKLCNPEKCTFTHLFLLFEVVFGPLCNTETSVSNFRKT